MDKSTVENLIERSIRNDEIAFRTLVEEYQYMIYKISFKLLCKEEEAKDAVQETFIKAWINLKKFDTTMKFSTWLYKIATNYCLDKLKLFRPTILEKSIDGVISSLISTENADQDVMNSELADIIFTITNNLSPKQKIVFTLFFFEELEVDEIVQITGLSPEKIKSNLYLARQTIREKLDKY